MRFESNKAWPHPVLRPKSAGDDYLRAEFEVDIRLERVPRTSVAKMTARFELSDADLLQLVTNGQAEFSVLIRAPRTQFRGAERTSESTIEREFEAGKLAGRVDISSFLIATGDLIDFRANGWHRDFDNLTFNISAGSVLAEDTPYSYWIDTLDDKPAGSIFQLESREGIESGAWSYDLRRDLVYILMSPPDYARFTEARTRVAGSPEAQNIMNGLYLPALIAVLFSADRDTEQFEHTRWFASLRQRLIDIGAKTLGDQEADRATDAQKLLGLPFDRMPSLGQTMTE